MAGPRYQPSTACGAHDARLVMASYINALVPGGARGVLLKSNAPSSISYADFDGSVRDVLNMFRVISAWNKR